MNLIEQKFNPWHDAEAERLGIIHRRKAYGVRFTNISEKYYKFDSINLLNETELEVYQRYCFKSKGYNGACRPYVAKFAESMKLSERQIYNILDKLESLGLILRRKQKYMLKGFCKTYCVLFVVPMAIYYAKAVRKRHFRIPSGLTRLKDEVNELYATFLKIRQVFYQKQPNHIGFDDVFYLANVLTEQMDAKFIHWEYLHEQETADTVDTHQVTQWAGKYLENRFGTDVYHTESFTESNYDDTEVDPALFKPYNMRIFS